MGTGDEKGTGLPLAVRLAGGAYDFDGGEPTRRVAYSFPYESPDTVEPELGEHELKEDASRARTPGS
jgi:hypothetical protein